MVTPRTKNATSISTKTVVRYLEKIPLSRSFLFKTEPPFPYVYGVPPPQADASSFSSNL